MDTRLQIVELCKERIASAKDKENLRIFLYDIIAALNMGEKNPNYGLKRSPETLEKMRLARKGFRHTEASKQKLREATLAQWQRKRQLSQVEQCV